MDVPVTASLLVGASGVGFMLGDLPEGVVIRNADFIGCKTGPSHVGNVVASGGQLWIYYVHPINVVPLPFSRLIGVTVRKRRRVYLELHQIGRIL